MRPCTRCGAENPDTARFCVQCGESLAASCPRCGSELPPGSRFCPACGLAVQEVAVPGEERKLVTVLFADVVGSTGLGERLDPERLKAVMGAYFESMRREIEAEGGTVEKFIGDAVMAVFGVPVAHEDDPGRAVRAALRMARALEELNPRLQAEHEVTLAMRIGINTGEVLATTSPRPGESMVAGEVVIVANRLESSARDGHILVGERTARAIRGFRLHSVGLIRLKGKEEAVRAFELIPGGLGEPGSGGGVLDRAGTIAPMVGRTGEMALLRTLYDGVVHEGRPHLVTVYGEAGVGKSRLVQEFVAWATGLESPPLTTRGRCLPYGEGVTYWPLKEILKIHGGVLDDDPPDAALDKIGTAVGDLLDDDGSGGDVGGAILALMFTLGTEYSDEGLGRLEPRQIRAEMHEAWRRFFSALARRGPTIVVIEDIHWADPAMLDLLEELAERAEGPLLFLCPARQELTSRRPTWGGGKWSFSAVLLDPLDESETTTLLGHLTGGEEIPDAVRRRIVERAGGNPFFLEEIVRHLVDERRAVAEGEGYFAAWDIEVVDIPDTVQGVLTARIDLLGAGEKRVLQMAAVVGRTFWPGAVERLVGGESARDGGLEGVLAALEERGLVTARLGSSMSGDREYAFRHALTRDVAYQSLPRRERAAAHAGAAEWIEQRAGERQREFAELLAHHYSEAYRAASEEPHHGSGARDGLREGAFRFALLASEDARKKLVLERAESFADEAYAIAATDLERSQALEAMGRAYFYDSRGDLAWERLREAIDIRVGVPGGGSGRSLAGLCASALEVVTRGRGSMRSRPPRSEADPYLELAMRQVGDDDSEELARLLIIESFWPSSFVGAEATEEDRVRAVAAGERAEGMARRLGRPDLASAALDGVGVSYLYSGRYGPMAPIVRRRIDLAAELSDPWELGDIYAVAAWWAEHMGRYDEAVDYASRGVDRTLSEAPLVAIYCLDWRALAKFKLGDWDGFFADAALADEKLGDRRERPPGFVTDHVAAGAFLHEVRGDPEAANRLLEQVAWLERAEDQPLTGWFVWRARLLARRGQFEEARSLIDRPDSLPAYGRDELLEAMTEVIAEQGAWADAPAVVAEARRHAEWAGVVPLGLFADRLEGRAALVAGDREGAAAALDRAARGFRSLGAQWEWAVTALSLAEATADRDRARAELDGAVQVFELLDSRRELVAARELIEKLG